MFKTQRRKCSNTSGGSKNLKPSFQKIKAFIEKSKKDQTLYANIQGSYERMVFSDMNDLRLFIYDTLFFANEDTLTMEKNSKVDRMKKEITSLANRFDTNGEVHMMVIWVYYYVYDTQESKAVPVFKLYKSKFSKSAIFLDPNYTKHSCWEDYLDHFYFPPSFLCVPVDGSYVFHSDSGMLKLMYINSKRSAAPNSVYKTTHTPCYNLMFNFFTSNVGEVIDFIKMPVKMVDVDLVILVCRALKIDVRREKFEILLNCWNLFREWVCAEDERKPLALPVNETSNHSKVLLLLKFLQKLSELFLFLLPKRKLFIVVILILKFLAKQTEMLMQKRMESKRMTKSNVINFNPPNGSTAEEGKSVVVKCEAVDQSTSIMRRLQEVSFEKLSREMESTSNREIVEGSEETFSISPSIKVPFQKLGELYLFLKNDRRDEEINKTLKELFKDFKLQPQKGDFVHVLNAKSRFQATLFFPNGTCSFLWIFEREEK